jgi:LuxR family maltose regulon positive regulatory protein
MDARARSPHPDSSASALRSRAESHPIVPAKLRRPRLRATLVPRPRLVRKLRQGRLARLTLVTGPAGAGKSTLLAQWAADDRETRPFAWLSLDAADRDPARLWPHLLGALRSVEPRIGGASSELAAARTIDELAGALAAELEEVRPFVLVFDSWQALDGSPGAEALLAVVRQAPDTIQVVVASRSLPRAALERLRLAGELAEITPDDLRLTQDETAELARALEVLLPTRALVELDERAEGWATGVQLLLREPRGDGLRDVLAFLRRSVLDDLTAETQDFLRRTSVLDRLTGPLCDAVAQTSASIRRLAELDDDGLFLVALDGTHEYRYNRLFADALALELELVEPELETLLHERASRWFEGDGDASGAVAHAIAARDVTRASELVATYAAAMPDEVVTGWLDALSWPAAVADAQLALVRATHARQATARDLEQWFAVAATDARPADEHLALGAASIESAIATLRSLYLCADLAEAEADARRALALEQAASPWRRAALAALAQCSFLAGRRDDARAALDEARRVPRSAGGDPAAPVALAVEALLALEAGEAARAEELARDGVSRLGSHVGVARVALGCAALGRGDVRLGVLELEHAVDELVPQGANLWRAYALLQLARADQARGARRDARRRLEAARRILVVQREAGIVGALSADTEQRLVERRPGPQPGAKLTESELRVLRLYELGLSRPQVAAALFVTTNTVKTHSRAIYRKLGVTSRTDAVERGGELGLL